MSTWSKRKKSRYFIILISAIVIVVAVPLFLIFYHAPTCTDGKQDGSELGVDCGGGCPILCSSEAQLPVVIWSRAFEIAPGVYSVVAYVENPNLDSIARGVPYDFTLYDANGVDIAERAGTATLPPGSTLPIFESSISTGDSVVSRTTFAFTSALVWQKQGHTASPVAINNQQYSGNPLPNLVADLTNTSQTTLATFPVVAILYDTNGNAISASRTFTDPMASGAIEHIVFTWPSIFSTTPVREDILPEPNQ